MAEDLANQSVDFSDGSYEKREFSLVTKGTYDVVLSATKRTSKNTGKEYLSLDFKIRDDVNQEFQNRHVFKVVWTDPNRPGWFDLVLLNKIIKTQKDLPTYTTKFANMDECLLYLNGLNLKVGIDTEFNDNTQTESNIVVDDSYDVPSPRDPTIPEDNLTTTADDLPF